MRIRRRLTLLAPAALLVALGCLPRTVISQLPHGVLPALETLGSHATSDTSGGIAGPNSLLRAALKALGEPQFGADFAKTGIFSFSIPAVLSDTGLVRVFDASKMQIAIDSTIPPGGNYKVSVSSVSFKDASKQGHGVATASFAPVPPPGTVAFGHVVAGQSGTGSGSILKFRIPQE